MSNIEVLPVDRWFADGINDDVLLCDPFTGDPLTSNRFFQHPNSAPDVFTNHPELGGGYGVWRGSTAASDGEAVTVGFLLTEPSDPNGLGKLEDFRDIMSNFSVVGYANKRSIRREAMARRAAPGIGSVTMGGEIVPDDTYMATLLDVAGEQNKVLFNFDPSVEFDGRSLHDVARAVQGVEDAARVLAIEQDPADADATVLGTDIVQANVHEWHGVGRSGLEVGKVWGEYGMFPPSVLLIVPGEHGDYVRKMEMSGPKQGAPIDVRSHFADPKFANITENKSYPLVMSLGFIPGSAFEGA